MRPAEMREGSAKIFSAALNRNSGRGDQQKYSALCPEVAFDAGFGDVSYFNCVFRRRCGGSPSDIRVQARRAWTLDASVIVGFVASVFTDCDCGFSIVATQAAHGMSRQAEVLRMLLRLSANEAPEHVRPDLLREFFQRLGPIFGERKIFGEAQFARLNQGSQEQANRGQRWNC